MESQRSYFGKALIELGRRNPDVVVVGADTTESIKTIDFGKAFPDRLFQLGIAEPNMISVAAGLAAAGKIAFAATYSVFGSGHTYNVIRQNVAYTNLNVKIFCSHAGLTVARCLEAADRLDRDGVEARVVNLSTVKPLDVATIDRAARETGGIVTAEEHTIVHGIGSAIATVIAANHPVPMGFVGVQDVFGESGEAEELLRKYGLTAEKIVDAARDVMKRRGPTR